MGNLSQAIHILHLNTERGWRGGENQLALMLQALSHLEHETTHHVVCLKDTALHRYLIEHKLPHLALGSRFQYSPMSLFRLKRYCDQHQIQILHAHTSKTLTTALLLKRILPKLKTVVTRKVALPLKKKTTKYNSPKLDAIVTVSQHIKDSLRTHTPKPVEVIYDGIETPSTTPLKKGLLHSKFNLKLTDCVIGYIAAFTWEKGQSQFIETLPALLKQLPNAKVVFFGEGQLLPQIQERAKELGMDQYVHFAGFVNPLSDYLPELDIVVHTPLSEGLGSSLLDCMAYKIPVLSVAVGGIPEIVQHKQTGWLAPSASDHKNIIKGIYTLATDTELRQHIVDTAKVQIQQFDYRTMTQKYISLYQSLIHKN